MDRAKVTFFDDNTKLYKTYEVLYKFIGAEVAHDIVWGFENLTGHYNRRSRDQAWRSVGKFCKYLYFMGFGTQVPKMDVVAGFGDFLQKINSTNKANSKHYSFIKRLVKWLSDESEKPLWQEHDVWPVTFIRKEAEVCRNSLTSTELKLIVEACKSEIVQARRNFEIRAAIETKTIVSRDQLNESRVSSLTRLINFEAEGVWSRKQLLDAGCAVLVGEGMKELVTYKELTQITCLPIFLMLMIQTAANPYALMEIGTNCLVTNPMDENSALLRWHKGRASKVQNIATLKKGNYSVASLVGLVLEMTRPIRHLASAADQFMLFLTRTGTKSKRLNVSGLHTHLAEFRKRNDLAYFTFRDIRRAVAEIVYTETRSVNAVAKVLQHKNVKTTEIYLRGERVKQHRYSNLAKFQGMMQALADGGLESKDSHYDTALGFRCASPLTGSVGRSRKGEPCMEFLMCAGCQNAIIPIDDAQVVARIVRARNRLNEMEISSHQDQGLRLRYKEIYQPILQIIERDILSFVKKSTLNSAERLANVLPALPVFY